LIILIILGEYTVAYHLFIPVSYYPSHIKLAF
jgi:hypothetical protein